MGLMVKPMVKQVRWKTRGPGSAGTLVLVVCAAAGGGRAGASERLVMHRSVPTLMRPAGRAAPRARAGDAPALVEEHRVALGRTWAAELPLGHFLSDEGRRVARLARTPVDGEHPATAILRGHFVPGFPGQPELELTTPLRVPTRLGTVAGELWTGLSDVRDPSGALLGVLGRTRFTSTEAVVSEAFWIDRAGEVRPLTAAQHREALRQHDTVVIAGATGEFSALVARLHFPAVEIPPELWSTRGAKPTRWSDAQGRHWGASTETRRSGAVKPAATGAPGREQRLRFEAFDGPDRAIALAPGWVELRTRLFELTGSAGEVTRQEAALRPTVADWRFMLQPSAEGSGLLVPLPQGGFGVTKQARQDDSPAAPRPGRGERRSPSGGQRPGVSAEVARRVLAGY